MAKYATLVRFQNIEHIGGSSAWSLLSAIPAKDVFSTPGADVVKKSKASPVPAIRSWLLLYAQLLVACSVKQNCECSLLAGNKTAWPSCTMLENNSAEKQTASPCMMWQASCYWRKAVILCCLLPVLLILRCSRDVTLTQRTRQINYFCNLMSMLWRFK